MPCCMLSMSDRINFGSLVEQGIEETWNGEAYQLFRDRLASDELPDVCRSCSINPGTF
jgi:radical SAM protein with 4Fe4S-binding SPASM domain